MKNYEKSWISRISQGFWEIWVSKVITPQDVCTPTQFYQVEKKANMLESVERLCPCGVISASWTHDGRDSAPRVSPGKKGVPPLSAPDRSTAYCAADR